MSRYLYLVLGLIFLVPSMAVAVWRRDLRHDVIKVGLIGAVWGPISEFWFFRDYWHPASVLGNPLLEDVIYGAGISAAASCVYKVVARRTYSAKPGGRRTHYREAGLIAIFYVGAMIILEMTLGVNSILVAVGVYIVAAAYIVYRRRDLWIASLCSAIIMGLIALVGYGIGLNFLVHEPATLSALWELYKKPLGITILGYVPLTEVIWYAAWGSLLGVIYEFATGLRLVPLRAGPAGNDPRDTNASARFDAEPSGTY